MMQKFRFLFRKEYAFTALGVLVMSSLYAYRYWLQKEEPGDPELRKAIFLAWILCCTFSVPLFFLVRFYCRLKDGNTKQVPSFKIVWESLAGIAIALVLIFGGMIALFGW